MKKNATMISITKYIIAIVFFMILGYGNINASFTYKASCTYASLDGKYSITTKKSILPYDGLHKSSGGFFNYISFELTQYIGDASKTSIAKLEKVDSFSVADYATNLSDRNIAKYKNINNIGEFAGRDASCSNFLTYNTTAYPDEVYFFSNLDNQEDWANTYIKSRSDSEKYKLVGKSSETFPDEVTCNYKLSSDGVDNAENISFTIKKSSESYDAFYDLKMSAFENDKLTAKYLKGYYAGEYYSAETYVERLKNGCPWYAYVYNNYAYLTDDGVKEAVNGRKELGGSYKVSIYEISRTEEENVDFKKTIQDQINALNAATAKYEECATNNQNNCSYFLEDMQDKVDKLDKACLAATSSPNADEELKTMCNSYIATRVDLAGAGIIDTFRHGCNIISTDLRNFINWILNLVKIAGPVVVIVMGSLDFIKAATSAEADANKKAFDKLVKRLLMAAIIFLIPALVQFIFTYFDVFSFANGLEPSNPFCL